MKFFPGIIFFLSLVLSINAFAVFDFLTSPSLNTGANVYKERCVLCHGHNGKGQGLISLPNLDMTKANLLSKKYDKDINSLRNIIIWGGFEKKMEVFSPPWGNELTWGEIESLILFIKHLRKDNTNAIQLLKTTTAQTDTKPDRKTGEIIFLKRCAICHDKTGDGRGRLANLMSNTKPTNLLTSQLTDEQLMNIITKGGVGVARSSAMPAWGSELSSSELQSLVTYLKHLRQ